MPDFSSSFKRFYNGDFLKAPGGPLTLTIKAAERENVGFEDKPKMGVVLYFAEENSLGLVLNVTRYQDLSGFFGSPNTDEWIGKRVEIFFDPTIKAPGGKRGGIGVRLPK